MFNYVEHCYCQRFSNVPSTHDPYAESVTKKHRPNQLKTNQKLVFLERATESFIYRYPENLQVEWTLFIGQGQP